MKENTKISPGTIFVTSARPANSTKSGKKILFYFEKLDFKDESCKPRNDGVNTVFAIAQFMRDGKFSFAANFHARDSHVPSPDDVPYADLYLKWCPAVT